MVLLYSCSPPPHFCFATYYSLFDPLLFFSPSLKLRFTIEHSSTHIPHSLVFISLSLTHKPYDWHFLIQIFLQNVLDVLFYLWHQITHTRSLSKEVNALKQKQEQVSWRGDYIGFPARKKKGMNGEGKDEVLGQLQVQGG